MLSSHPAAAATQPRFPSTLTSPLVGVPLPSWQRFVRALEVQAMGAVSPRGGLGSYDLKPQRLVDLGLCARHTATRRGESRVTSYRFVPPWTQDAFLHDPRAQLEALARSMRLYQDDLRAGRRKQPEGVSLAGALALLHCGPGALAAWPHLFPHSRALYERAQGAF